MPKATVTMTLSLAILALTLFNTVECKQKEVIVIGGGIAGLAAARTIQNNRSADYQVRILEAKRDRYGGRVWTDRKSMPDATGIEVDMGAGALNTEAADNPLINFTDRMELRTTKLGPMQLFVPKLNKKFSGTELVEYFIEARKLYMEAIEAAKVKSSDQSVRSLVLEVVRSLRGQGDSEVVASIMELLPTYNSPDFSAKLYRGDMLDFGYNTHLTDGMAELADRLVSGGDGESPLSIELRKVVRQVKIDDRNKQVTVRLSDGSQTKADAVVVAVPAAVIRDDKLMFEPSLPQPYVDALKTLGTSNSNKVVVEFAEAFWPKDIGVFIMGASKKDQLGMLQKWLNMENAVGRPVLVGFIGGPASIKFENMTDDEVKTIVRQKLTTLFGDAAEKTEIVKLARSSWKSSSYAGMSSSYPRVGTNSDIWNTLSDPLCPYIYFAGEHTTYKGLGSLHGAYNSGVRAAQQLMGELCEDRAREEEKRKKEEEEKREKAKKEKNEGGKEKDEQKDDEQKKDEL